jgi:transketolase
MRTTRGATPVIYSADEDFPVGGSKIVRRSDDDELTLIGAGVTLHEALAAADMLDRDGIRVRVIDLYSLKPVDTATIAEAATDTGAIVTVEDHWPEGGLGDAVLDALAEADVPARVRKLAVRDLVGSGKPEELLREAGIDRDAIAATARSLAREGQPAEARA